MKVTQNVFLLENKKKKVGCSNHSMKTQSKNETKTSEKSNIFRFVTLSLFIAFISYFDVQQK